MEGILFFLNTNFSFYIHSNIQFSSYDFKSAFKEFPSRIVWNNGNFQILITISMSFKQCKINNPMWSFLIEIIVKNYLLWVTCNDSPFGNKIPSLFTRSHLIPLQLLYPIKGTCEFLPRALPPIMWRFLGHHCHCQNYHYKCCWNHYRNFHNLNPCIHFLALLMLKFA